MPKRVDPVCGMKLDPGQIEAQSSYKGKEYDFCSEECKRIFDNDPKFYTEKMPERNADSPQPGSREPHNTAT